MALAVELARIYWWAVVLVLLGFAVAYRFVAPAPSREITIATGAENGGYHRFGQRLQAALEKKQLKVTIRSTGGTIENLKLLQDPRSGVSVAFGQGGSERYYDGETDRVRALGSLYYEPLWIFYRKDSQLASFGDLRKMKIAVGRNGSGTQVLAKLVLAENNIPESVGVPIGFDEAVKALQANTVQALFLVAPVNDPSDRHKPHPDVYRLMSDPNLGIYEARRAQAYLSRLPHLSLVTIGEGLLDLEKNYPASTLTLVSPMATLLCRDDLDGDIAALILQTCREIQSEGAWLEKAGDFPSKIGVTFPLLPEAKQFLEKGPSFFYKHLPFWAANAVNRLWIMAIPLVTLVFPLLKLALPTYRWRMRRRIAVRYRFLQAIDERVAAGTIGATIDEDIDHLRQYENELARLSVPVMFAGEFYSLRMHAYYLRTRLEEIKRAPTGH
jgi:uncharacterized protein